MLKRGVMVGALILVVTLGSGCMASTETRHGAKELRERLGTPSWATSVDVGTGLDGQYADHVQTTVKLNGGATADEVSDFVVAMPAAAEKAGLEDVSLGLTFVAATGSTLDIEWEAEVVLDEVGRGVTEWFGFAAALGPTAAASLRSDGGASYVVTLGDSATFSVRDAADLMRVEGQPDTAVQVTGTDGPLALDLSTSVPPTAQQLDTWDALLGALDELPTDLSATGLSLHFLDRIVADVVLVAPDDTTDETFTIATYGGDIWPVAHPQLDALAALPDAWSYFVSWVPASYPTWEHLFISLLSDQDPIDNGDEPTRWSQAAADYVQGL